MFAHELRSPNEGKLKNEAKAKEAELTNRNSFSSHVSLACTMRYARTIVNIHVVT